ncbi:MAG: ABC transporter permease subunit [Planctomyces sp.]|nr:ABC transporter permease subunit [Planctomyces sp.]
MRFLKRPETPLLLKELSELAARRRTYVVRFAYATALFAAGLLLLFGGNVNPEALLGRGLGLFQSLFWIEYVAVLVLVPAITASALTIEKERETLAILLLTTIRPVEIILQKFLSRVVPALSYVMLSFPLMAVAYSYGGVTRDHLLIACGSLILAVIYSASFSLLCSSYFRTTVEAVMASYAGPVVISVLTLGLAPFMTGMPGSDSFLGATPENFVLLFARVSICSLLALLLATEFLQSRAFVPARNVLLQVFQAMDRWFNEWNTVTGGVVLVHDGKPLPEDHPVAWRETSKRSLGTFRYLVRVLVVLELPILFVSQMVNIEMVRGHQSMSYLWYTLWVISVAMLCVHAANVITSERSRQTLDVLLATPIPGRQLMQEKLAGVRRLLLVLSVPFVTIIAFEHWYRDYKWDLSYLAQSLTATVVFGWLLMWIAFSIGLRMRSGLAAIFTSLGVVAAACGVPLLLSYAARLTLRGAAANVIVAGLSLNPATILRMAETVPAEEFRMEQGWSRLSYPWGFAGGLALYVLAGLYLRRRCLRGADARLGRPTTHSGTGQTRRPPAGNAVHASPDSSQIPAFGIEPLSP